MRTGRVETEFIPPPFDISQCSLFSTPQWLRTVRANSFLIGTGPFPATTLNGTKLKVQPMLIVLVHVRVKPEFIDAFRKATEENARHSIQEPGIARFDVLQQADDPGRFVLLEAYRTLDAPAQHKETRHYQEWRDAVAPMMQEPRSSARFTNLFPADLDLGHH